MCTGVGARFHGDVHNSGGSLTDAVEFLREGGIGRAVLAGVDDATRDRAVGAVREALAPYLTDEGVRIGTAAWLVTAQRPQPKLRS